MFLLNHAQMLPPQPGLLSNTGPPLLPLFMKRFDNRIQIAVQYLWDIAPAFLDTMVGYAILGKIVRPYLLATVAGADLLAPFLGDVASLFFQFNLTSIQRSRLAA